VPDERSELFVGLAMRGRELSPGDDPLELVVTDHDALDRGIRERPDELRDGCFWREFDVLL